MGLFTTKTRHTSYRPPTNRGSVHTSKAKTRAKRWAKRGVKKLWRTAKWQARRDIRTVKRKIQRSRRQHQRTHNRQLAQRWANASRAHYQPTPNSGVQLQSQTPDQTAAGPPPPPPDGAIGTCSTCSNEVIYNAARERWEHTGHGHYECFQPK